MPIIPSYMQNYMTPDPQPQANQATGGIDPLKQLTEMLSQLGMGGMSNLGNIYEPSGGLQTNPFMNQIGSLAQQFQGLQGMPALDRNAQMALQKINQDAMREAQGAYDQSSQSLVNRLFAQGMNDSTAGNELAGQLQGEWGRALSALTAQGAEREIAARQQQAQQTLANLQSSLQGLNSGAGVFSNQQQLDIQNQQSQKAQLLQLLELLMRQQALGGGYGYGQNGDQGNGAGSGTGSFGMPMQAPAARSSANVNPMFGGGYGGGNTNNRTWGGFPGANGMHY